MDFNLTAPGRTPILQYYVTALLVLLALTGIIDLFTGELIDRPINIHHVVALLGLFVFFTHGRVILPPLSVNIFFITLLIISGIAALWHGIHPMLLNSAYCYYLTMLGLVCANGLTRIEYTKALRIAACIILVAITIKNIFYIHDIADALDNMQGRVYIPTIVAGGPNIEATTALFAAVLLRGSRSYWPAYVYALFMAILYSSRAAILGCTALFVYEVIGPAPSVMPWLKQFRSLGLISIAAIIVIMLFSSSFGQFTFSRFENIGYEAGSESRIAMWQTVPQIFMNNPMGLGAGNAMHEIERELGHDVQEDNVHNIYLQALLDTGILGLAAYIFMVLTIVHRGLIYHATNPLWIVLGLYFLMGVMQFRLYDPAIFFALGLAWYKRQDDQA